MSKVTGVEAHLVHQLHTETRKRRDKRVGLKQKGSAGRAMPAIDLQAITAPAAIAEGSDGSLTFRAVNAAFARLLHHPASDLVGRHFDDFIDLNLDSSDHGASATVMAEHGEGLIGTFRKGDGSRGFVAVSLIPLMSLSAQPDGHLVLVTDSTASIERQTKAEALIAELSHRNKNTLSIVAALIRQAAAQSIDGKVARETLEDRVLCLARSQDLLRQGDGLSASLADVAVSGVSILDRAGNGHLQRVTLSGDPCRITADTALALSWILNELATNAVKYGAFSNDHGHISVSWHLNKLADPLHPHVLLTWREQDGPPVKRPTRSGFGMKLIQRGLGEHLPPPQLSYATDGLRCILAVPVET
jgi:two-component sensor histidine kinase